MMLKAEVANGLSFTERDVVDLDSFIPAGEYNPHNVRPWLLHDHGFTLAVVFADCLQDALDEAVDAGKLDHLQVSDDLLESDYFPLGDGEYEGISYLGNASEPFDTEGIGFVELPIPEASFTAQYLASKEERETEEHFREASA